MHQFLASKWIWSNFLINTSISKFGGKKGKYAQFSLFTYFSSELLQKCKCYFSLYCTTSSSDLSEKGNPRSWASCQHAIILIKTTYCFVPPNKSSVLWFRTHKWVLHVVHQVSLKFRSICRTLCWQCAVRLYPESFFSNKSCNFL